MKYYLTGIPLTYTTGDTWIIEEIIYKNQSIILSSFDGPTFTTSTRAINISPSKLNPKELKERYYTMQEKDTFNVVNLVSEVNDDYSDDSLFNISSWGADLSFRELISMYEENELLKPELQRNFKSPK